MEHKSPTSRSRSPARSQSRSKSPRRYSPHRSYSPRDSYYDRGYSDRGGYDMYDRGNYYDERYPPNPRKRYEIIKGNEVDRNNSTCLYVGNLPYSFREEEVLDMFGKCGKINSVSVPLDKYTGRNKGFAFIAFDERSGAEQAKDMFTGYEVEARKLRIDWDIGREKKDVLKRPFEEKRFDRVTGYDERKRFEPRYDDRKYDHPRFDDRRYGERKYDHPRRFDSRYDDRKYDQGRYDDHKFDRSYPPSQNRFDQQFQDNAGDSRYSQNPKYEEKRLQRDYPPYSDIYREDPRY